MTNRLFAPSLLLALTLTACSERATELAYEEDEAQTEAVPAPPPTGREQAKSADQPQAARPPAPKLAPAQPSPDDAVAAAEPMAEVEYKRKTELDFSGVDMDSADISGGRAAGATGMASAPPPVTVARGRAAPPSKSPAPPPPPPPAAPATTRIPPSRPPAATGPPPSPKTPSRSRTTASTT